VEAGVQDLIVEETTSTSSKFLVFLTLTVLLAGSTLATHDTGSGSITSDKYGGTDGFGIPTYDTQGETLTKLVAPFLLITLLLQIGLRTALESVLLRGIHDPRQKRKKRKQVRKHSTLMALAIAGMTIPSPLFKYINEYVAVLYGGITWLFLLGAVIFFGMILWSGMSGGGRHE